MGLKADSSFLRFVTMGAVGALSVVEHLRALGFQPIELERYCTSNKIWQTKVKRLRLPDLLCLRSGVRFEVRGKSTLSVKMSHAPNNPDRAWDAGLADDDIAAFVWVEETAPDVFAASHAPVCFTIGDMRATAELAKLGPPKSASEGAERDLEWPTTVPKKPGRVTALGDDRLSIFKAGEARPNYTYRLRGKTPYVAVGDEFVAHATILAGVLPRTASLGRAAARRWNPAALLAHQDPLTRYAATKATSYLCQGDEAVAVRLLKMACDDAEPRVAIEAAGAVARLGYDEGFEQLLDTALKPDAAAAAALTIDAARMEAVLILTEVARTGDRRATDALVATATSRDIQASEIVQAAVWGLGRAGARDYERLVDFVGHDDRDVALHAICAFHESMDDRVVEFLVTRLAHGSPRVRASACEILARYEPPGAVPLLAEVGRAASPASAWALAALGRMSPDLVVGLEDLQAAIRPVQVMHHESWLGDSAVAEDIGFLAAQVLGT